MEDKERLDYTRLEDFWRRFKEYNKNILLGDLSGLKTSEKTTIIDAINEIKSMIDSYNKN